MREFGRAAASVLQIAGRTFRPGWVPSLAAAAFIALAVALGDWQTRRAEEKLAAGRMLDLAAQAPVLRLPSERVGATAFERRNQRCRPLGRGISCGDISDHALAAVAFEGVEQSRDAAHCASSSGKFSR